MEANDRVTLWEVLTAIFTEDRDQPQTQPQPQPESAPTADIVPLTVDERPGQIIYPPDAAPFSDQPSYAMRQILQVGAGTVTAMAVGIFALIMLRESFSLLGLMLLVGAAGGWLFLMTRDEIGRRLFVRGPRLEGGGPARPLLTELDQWDLLSRVSLGLTGVVLAVLTFISTANNAFTTVGFMAWIVSTAAIMTALAERSLPQLIDDSLAWFPQRIRSIQLQPLPLIALAVIVAAAIFMRFWQLDAVPPEMTSDHVEKLLDSYRLLLGDRDVFMRGNGGRESLHFYFVALVSQVFGTGMTFTTLKIASGIEAVLLIPLMVVLGRELVDRETGYYAAALVALSWWHILLGRLALRIVLTPLVFALVLIVLIRGLRTGARRSWLWAGFWLGVGMYTYQAMRMAPLAAIAALIVVAAVQIARLVRDPRREEIATNVVVRQSLNLMCAGLVAFTIFVPMARVWRDYPNDLWNRVVNRTTSSEVSIEGSSGQIFANNYIDALGMFHATGDGAWFTSNPEEPALSLAGGLLMAFGLVAWAFRLWHRRDPVDLFVLAAFLIMLLPSALAVAFPRENPSLTRASGVIPIVFVWAAWPLSLLRQRWAEQFGQAHGTVMAGVLIVVLIGGAAFSNAVTYFEGYEQSYRESSPNPGEIADAIRQTTTPEVSSDQVWIVSWPFWQDHRALGLEFGDIGFSNVILESAMLPDRLSEARFETRPLVFVINPNDQLAVENLEARFPSGELRTFNSRTFGKDFNLYVVFED